MTNDPRSGIDKQVDYLVNVLSDLQFKVHKLTERVEELEEYEEPVDGEFCGMCGTPWAYSTGECQECDPVAIENELPCDCEDCMPEEPKPEADNTCKNCNLCGEHWDNTTGECSFCYEPTARPVEVLPISVPGFTDSASDMTTLGSLIANGFIQKANDDLLALIDDNDLNVVDVAGSVTGRVKNGTPGIAFDLVEPKPGTFEDTCDTYWGSHGCDYVSNHTGNHKCYGCYEAWEQDGVVWCKDPGGEPFEYGGKFFVADNYGDLTWDVEGLAAGAYIKPATSGKPGITFQVLEDDYSVNRNLVEPEQAPEEQEDPIQVHLLEYAQSEYPAVRQITANNPDCPPYLLMFLSYDENDGVRSAVAKNKNTSDKVLWKLTTDEDFCVRAEVARNPSTSRNMLLALTGDLSSSVRYIAKQKLEEDNSGSCSICGGYCGE